MSLLQESIKQIDFIRDEAIDQGVGFYDGKTPCCFGAHLANFYEVSHSEVEDFRRGAFAWSKAMGGNIIHAYLMLKGAGAGGDPFGGSPWDKPIGEVLDNLKTIEELPTLAGAKLPRLRFDEVDLEGADLHGIDFENTILFDCNLDNANMTGAKMHNITIRHSSMRNINLMGTDLDSSCLDDVDLTDACLDGAAIKDTNWFDVKLDGVTAKLVRIKVGEIVTYLNPHGGIKEEVSLNKILKDANHADE